MRDLCTNKTQSAGREHAMFLGAVFIATVTSQASMVVDTAIGGALLGENVVSAVNLVMPIEEVFFALSLLLGMGACTAASFAFGKGISEEVRRHFTAAIISAAAVYGVLALGLILGRQRVVDALCGDSFLREYTSDYLMSVLPWFVVGNLVGIVIQFVSMTGKPHLAMYASIAYCASNGLFDWLLVGVLGCGIEGLGYSSLISTFVALLIVMPYWLRSPFWFRGDARQRTRLYLVTTGVAGGAFGEFMQDVRTNLHYGKGLITGEISYIVFTFAMNALVLRYLGEEGLFCWSVVMMLFMVCNFAAAASQETCLSLGGRYLGAGHSDWAGMVFRRSMAFTVGWVVVCLVIVLALPDLMMHLLGAPDASIYPTLVTVIALTTPVTIGLNLVNLYIVRLISHNRVERFTILVGVLYLSVPLVFYIAHLVFPGYEWLGMLALVPVQIVVGSLNLSLRPKSL